MQDTSPEALLEKLLSSGVSPKEAVALYQEALQLQRRSIEALEAKAKVDEAKVKAENRRAAVAESVFVQVVEQTSRVERLLELVGHLRYLIEEEFNAKLDTVRLGVEELVIEISSSMADISEGLQEHDQRIHDALFFIISIMTISDDDRAKARAIIDPEHDMRVDDRERLEVIASLKKRYRDASARMRVLREREAKHGAINAPTNLQIEIQDTRTEIEELEVAIDALSKPKEIERKDAGGVGSLAGIVGDGVGSGVP